MFVPYKWRERACSECGELFSGYLPPAKAVRCPECGIKVMTANSLGMACKSGIGYSRWLASAGPRGRPRKS